MTISTWLLAYSEGAEPRALLRECLHQARACGPEAAWIYLASDDDFGRQLEALEAQVAGLAGLSTIEQVLARFPLYGVPYAVKDNIDIEGVPTTAGCPAFTRIARSSAAAVRRLQAAGAIWVGKTNLDQFATGLVGTRSPYGRPASVFSARHVSGGSSSGSAVVVASGRVAFSLGTDTAGSGRVPAAYNQIVGLKPTPGRVGASGVIPACRTLDCVSVLALSVEDAAQVLAVIEGPDADDLYSRFRPGPADWPRIGGALRIGIPAAPRLAPDREYEAPYARALAHAKALGHTLVALDFTPLHRTAELLYAGPWVAERHSAVRSLLANSPHALDPAVRQVIMTAEHYSATDLFDAQYALRSLQRETSAIWNSVDVLLVPSAPGHPTFSDVDADPIGANSALGVYTNFVNLLGWCALAVPAGTSAAGLPFGVTFIAPACHDAALVRLGQAWQSSLGLTLGATGTRMAQAPHAAFRLRTPAVRESLHLAVVGAHLSGMPLNGQLTERDARLVEKTRTAARYRLHALPGSMPPKPGLVRVADGGCAIELEVWEMPASRVGSFLALIAPPLALGSVELDDGRWVHGFLCETHAVAQAADVSEYGGWRAYMQQVPASSRAAGPQSISRLHG